METVNKIYKQESSKLFAGTYPRNAEIFSLPPSFARKSLTVWRIITRSSAHTFDHSPPPLPPPPRNLRTVCRPFNRRPYIVASSSSFFLFLFLFCLFLFHSYWIRTLLEDLRARIFLEREENEILFISFTWFVHRSSSFSLINIDAWCFNFKIILDNVTRYNL